MGAAMERRERRVYRHDVDRFGLVDCPWSAHDPTLDECSDCAQLVGAVTDEEGMVVAVRCRKSRSTE
jgi:hypothetical protein